MPAEPAVEQRRLPFGRRLVLFLAVLGPGLITASVDNDAGGITTYSVAGATWGYDLLWTLIPITIALIVVQEMSARMGVVTGKGLSDLIRENFGVRVTFWMAIALIVANLGNVVAEFAGVASSLQIFGVPIWLSVPASARIRRYGSRQRGSSRRMPELGASLARMIGSSGPGFWR
jgi:Mn2+/Fe2+ NRAMP family transporter